MRIRAGVEQDQSALLDLWLRSVRASHDFLTEQDIQFFYPLVRDHALRDLDVVVLETDAGELMGFMGMAEHSIEALFLDPNHLRKGGGRLLVEWAENRWDNLKVDVNEQNPTARLFYESLGFVVESRSEKDGTGRPFPLLHMHMSRDGSQGDSG